jgi:hypothetical protein
MGWHSQEQMGAEIMRWRRERQLTRAALAAAVSAEVELERDAEWLGRVESGQQGISTYDLVALAKSLGIAVDALLRDGYWAEQERRDRALERVGDTPEAREAMAMFEQVIADYQGLEALCGSGSRAVSG